MHVGQKLIGSYGQAPMGGRLLKTLSMVVYYYYHQYSITFDLQGLVAVLIKILRLKPCMVV